MRALDAEPNTKEVVMLNKVGLDPGVSSLPRSPTRSKSRVIGSAIATDNGIYCHRTGSR
jgi:hypothetical protein